MEEFVRQATIQVTMFPRLKIFPRNVIHLRHSENFPAQSFAYFLRHYTPHEASERLHRIIDIERGGGAEKSNQSCEQPLLAFERRD